MAAIVAGSSVAGSVGWTEYSVNSAGRATSPLAGYTNRLSGSSAWNARGDQEIDELLGLVAGIGAAQHAGELDLAKARGGDDGGGSLGDGRIGEQDLGRRARCRSSRRAASARRRPT